MKVSRPIRELAWKAYAVRERLERENGRDPTLAEIAGELDVTVEEIVEAMESGAEVGIAAEDHLSGGKTTIFL